MASYQVIAYGPDGLKATALITPDKGLTFGEKTAAVTKATTDFGTFMCEMWDVKEVDVSGAGVRRKVTVP